MNRKLLKNIILVILLLGSLALQISQAHTPIIKPQDYHTYPYIQLLNEQVIKAQKEAKSLNQQISLKKESLKEILTKLKTQRFQQNATSLIFTLKNGNKVIIPFPDKEPITVTSSGEAEIKLKNLELKNRLNQQLLQEAYDDLEFQFMEIHTIVNHAINHYTKSLEFYKNGKDAQGEKSFQDGHRNFNHAQRTIGLLDAKTKEIYKLIGKIHYNQREKQNLESQKEALKLAKKLIQPVN